MGKRTDRFSVETRRQTKWVVPLATVGLGSAFSVLTALTVQDRLLGDAARIMRNVSPDTEQVILTVLFCLGVVFSHGSAYLFFALSDQALGGGQAGGGVWTRRFVAGAVVASAVGGLFIQLFLPTIRTNTWGAAAFEGGLYGLLPYGGIAAILALYHRQLAPAPPLAAEKEKDKGYFAPPGGQLW